MLNNERARDDYRSSTISVISNFRRSRSSAFFFSPLASVPINARINIVDRRAREANQRTKPFVSQNCERMCERAKNVAKLRRRRDRSFHARGYDETRKSNKSRSTVRLISASRTRKRARSSESTSVVRIIDVYRWNRRQFGVHVYREVKPMRRAELVGIFESNPTGLFAVVTVSPIEITSASDTNGFGRRWPFRPIIAVKGD